MARRRRQNAGAKFAAAVIVMTVLGLSGYIRLPALFWLSLGAFVAVVIAIWAINRRPSLSPATAKPTAIAPDTSTWSLELLKALDWKRFEELCTWYFQESGHTAKVTGAGADGGVDIWIYDAADAGTVSGVAQCKAWTDKQVGVKEVRELFGVMNHVGCRYGVFFGMSGFTGEARSFAANKEIDLVSAEQLLDLIAVLPREVQDDRIVSIRRFFCAGQSTCGLPVPALAVHSSLFQKNRTQPRLPPQLLPLTATRNARVPV